MDFIETNPIQWQQTLAISAGQLANQFGMAIWIPVPWPLPGTSPEFVLFTHGNAPPKYHLRPREKRADFMWVLGQPSVTRTNMPSSLEDIGDMQFETLAKGQPGHNQVVVRIPELDVHLAGTASLAFLIAAARTLSPVMPE
jgi:hypothetical protein